MNSLNAKALVGDRDPQALEFSIQLRAATRPSHHRHQGKQNPNPKHTPSIAKCGDSDPPVTDLPPAL